MSRGRHPIFFLLLLILLHLLGSNPAIISAQEKPGPATLVSWAPATGPQALWLESLEGLKASFSLINANGGLDGRPLAVIALNQDDYRDDFLHNLARALNRPGVLGAVGGPVGPRAVEISDYFRRVGQPWLGPWTNQPEIYQSLPSDPLAILPTRTEELPALLGYLDQALKPLSAGTSEGRRVSLVYLHQSGNLNLPVEVRELADRLGLEMTLWPLNTGFSDWGPLSEKLAGNSAVILWLPPGPAAALVRIAKPRLPDALWLTCSSTATHKNMSLLSNGQWAGMIFPSVLLPSREIPDLYQSLIKKYGSPGLSPGYQTYLGFCQGQLAARALSLSGGQDLTQGLYQARGYTGLLAAPFNLGPEGHINPLGFRLARANADGGWEWLE